jgi:hypothetical protein
MNMPRRIAERPIVIVILEQRVSSDATTPSGMPNEERRLGGAFQTRSGRPRPRGSSLDRLSISRPVRLRDH